MPSANTRRKLVLHIGHHKTGSTSIQNAFATGMVRLDGGTILYPAEMAHNYLRRHVDAFIEDGKILNGGPGMPNLPALAETLQTNSFDYAVLSGEEFEGASPRAVKKTLSRFLLPHVSDHLVVCYIRPHAARVLSSYAEQVKLGLFDGTPDEFLDKCLRRQRFFFTKPLSTWRKVFGEHFVLRPMIREQLVNNSVLDDFLAASFDADTRVSVVGDQSANESMSLEDLMIARIVQQRMQERNRQMRHAMGWELSLKLAANTLPGVRRTKVRLHKALAERIRTTYLADARDLDARFFDRKPLLASELERAVDEALPEAQSFEPSDHFDATALRSIEVLADIIDGMLDHNDEPWPAYLRAHRLAELHEARAEKPAPRKAPGAARGKTN
ncbi:MAG: hypothetical protein H6898_12630 [Rhodobacter sp.]|nr:hypothetical protein [Paracoccaceae bacterium]MCC0077401.1 hypothetical protein [Rhodobacter sp.]